MPLKTAWIVSQILPLLINCETSGTVYVDRPPSAESPWLQSRFAGDIDWNHHQKMSMPSPGNPIKPDTRPAVSSGGGSFPRVMSLKTALIVLQEVNLSELTPAVNGRLLQLWEARRSLTKRGKRQLHKKKIHTEIQELTKLAEDHPVNLARDNWYRVSGYSQAITLPPRENDDEDGGVF
ncbi:hypothetical protein HPB47_004129 [Ixodes persulcatus]|uniref:Uncharacterized protein n=1 Tax=Ixodes persulcatus TaxID=34615 RepID=A0AC60PGP7_IXOPE|nr:hypothetical protein HPB47_004129 [Ixodes persulcatus]